MLNRIIKFILIGISAAWMVYQFSLSNIGNGILFVFITAIFVLSLFRHELLLWAFVQLRRGKYDKAAAILDRVKHPEALPSGQEAYYYFLRGLSMSQTNNITKSEKFFKRAVNTGLRMKQDQAVAKLNLAGIAVMKRRKREAMNLLAEVKKLDKNKMLDEQVKMIQTQMKRI